MIELFYPSRKSRAQTLSAGELIEHLMRYPKETPVLLEESGEFFCIRKTNIESNKDMEALIIHGDDLL